MIMTEEMAGERSVRIALDMGMGIRRLSWSTKHEE